ncbi:MAG TPA: ABC transporter ATP-binding protein [Microbacteriaceae bacterium]|nr:ABC transporter ATP-binding protein [Microbacteriaceae bacterium]
MTEALTFEGVSRTFRTRGETVQAVTDLSFTVESGETVCLLGPNGAGKTTTVKMASTLLAASTGRITIAGFDADRDARAARARLGLALGGERGFYMRSSALSNLRFFARIQGVARRDVDARVQNALDTVRLSDVANRPVEQLSKGMKQRLHIARAIVHRPALLILDEPSSGLDIESAYELRALICHLRDAGAGILFTTHSMTDAEMCADRLLVVARGQLLAHGTAEEISRHAAFERISTLRVKRLGSETAGPLAFLRERAAVTIREGESSVSIDVFWRREEDIALHASAVSALAGDSEIWTRKPTLEELYLAITSSPPGVEP